jgi:hypothetical protein
MRWRYRRKRFDFDQHALANHDIRPKAKRQHFAFVDHRDRHFPLEGDRGFVQFVGQAFAINSFEQTWSDCLMNLNRHANDLAGEFPMHQHASPP